MNPGASITARVAGALGVLAYVTGLVDGPVIGAVAALALIAFGRALVSPRGAELIGPVGFAVLAGAAGAAALRWGTLDLAAIQGAQGVLGPTVAVGPVAVAVLASAALVAAAVALGLWLTDLHPSAGIAAWWGRVEVVAGALTLAALFSGPPPSDFIRTAIWLGSAAAIAAAALVVARLTGRLGAAARLLGLGACGVVVTVAASVAGTMA